MKRRKQAKSINSQPVGSFMHSLFTTVSKFINRVILLLATFAKSLNIGF